MEAEHESLLKNETWRLISLLPDRKLIRCKWVYMIETHSDGSVAKFKARLIAKGCTQQFGIDYDQMFSSMVKYESI